MSRVSFIDSAFRSLTSLSKVARNSLIAFSIIVFLGIWMISNHYFERLTQDRFNVKVIETSTLIAKGMARYGNVLHNGIGFFKGSDYVSAEEWRRFIGELDLPRHYPGIQGIGYVEITTREAISGLERQMRLEGYPDFSVRPAGVRDVYAPILYLEPTNRRNLEAIGYDVFSEPTRRRAAEQARDTGKAVITSRIELVQEIDSDVQPGILMMHPLFQAGAEIMTIQQRREAFIGYVGSAFRMNDLMRHLISKDIMLDFEIHDSPEMSDEHLLYRSFVPSSDRPRHHVQKRVELYGQTWYIDLWSTPGFERNIDRVWPIVSMVVGSIIYLSFLFLLLYLIRTRDKAIENVFFLRDSQRAAGIGSYSLDFQTMIWTSSETLDEIFGIDDSYERSQKGWLGLIHPDDQKKMGQYLTDVVIDRHSAFDREYRIIRQNDHAERWIHGLGQLRFDSDGTLLKMVGTNQDITELKRKDEMLIAQSRSAAMGEMINMIAHQWRQPLSVIAMDANSMLADIDLDDFNTTRAGEYAHDVLKRTQDLSKTIDDFRNFFKPDKAIAKVRLQDILEETSKIIIDTLSSHHIKYEASFRSGSEVDAYPRELMHVFVNIISNAKEALVAAHHDDPVIIVKVYEDDRYVITDICDNGIGIAPSIIDKVFDPYFTTKEKQTGTGLGLYMSKMIIEEHLHGKIEALDQDRGACIRVSLLKDIDKATQK